MRQIIIARPIDRIHLARDVATIFIVGSISTTQIIIVMIIVIIS